MEKRPARDLTLTGQIVPVKSDSVWVLVVACLCGGGVICSVGDGEGDGTVCLHRLKAINRKGQR